MSKRQEEESGSTNMSRRGFLKGGGVATVGALLGSVGLTGCGTSTTNAGTSPSPSGSATVNDPTHYTVIDTDILFIGSGYGAIAGIQQAVDNKRKVTVLDKGVFRGAGASGYNWGSTSVALKNRNPDGSTNWRPVIMGLDAPAANNGYLTDKWPQVQAYGGDPYADKEAFFVNTGGACLPERSPDGKLLMAANNAFLGLKVWGQNFPRHNQDAYADLSAVKVYDRTMVTNILVNNGVCVGAVALDLKTGNYQVYKANAVIMATGPAGWFMGWEKVSAKSGASPDNTNDVEMALYRQGVGIGDAEFSSYDIQSNGIPGIAYGTNAVFGADNTRYACMVNRDGVNWFANQVPAAGITPPALSVLLAKYVHENPDQASPAGGIYLKTSDPAALATMSPHYIRNVGLWKSFGIDPTTQNLEAVFVSGERGGQPVVDDNGMTEIKGLFTVRGAGQVQGEAGGAWIGSNMRNSSYCVRNALAYLGGATAPSGIDFSAAVAEFSRLDALRTRAGSGGIRPIAVRQQIQKAVEPCIGPLRITADLNAAAATLAQIRSQVMPKQVCADQSRTFNLEWRQAIENYNLLDAAEIYIQATLARQESRGFYRPDFPAQDDANFHCMLVARQTGGSMAFSKRGLSSVDYSTGKPVKISAPA